ncbi:hypothetical protein NDU88_003301 [Pleurodeles waltl]|uniref:Uncharacterized protein n=1 Tax=Pleurodeles waltl TaxID=8319 RepID=A0AAV7T4L1_PLEWA|nr:hypothetical protein NDU88_003301 [Pleurodeles waltl]
MLQPCILRAGRSLRAYIEVRLLEVTPWIPVKCGHRHVYSATIRCSLPVLHAPAPSTLAPETARTHPMANFTVLLSLQNVLVEWCSVQCYALMLTVNTMLQPCILRAGRSLRAVCIEVRLLEVTPWIPEKCGHRHVYSATISCSLPVLHVPAPFTLATGTPRAP